MLDNRNLAEMFSLIKMTLETLYKSRNTCAPPHADIWTSLNIVADYFNWAQTKAILNMVAVSPAGKSSHFDSIEFYMRLLMESKGLFSLLSANCLRVASQ